MMLDEYGFLGALPSCGRIVAGDNELEAGREKRGFGCDS